MIVWRIRTSLPLLFLAISLGALALLGQDAEGGPVPLFSDVTKSAGLADLPLLESYSFAAADFDLDGYSDIFVSHHGNGGIRLWRNNRHGGFDDVTSLVPYVYGDIHGVSFIDLNQDGYPDIAIACGARRGRGEGVNQYYINQQGKGFVRWVNVPDVLLDPRGRSRSITPVDFDQDGRMDLLLFNFFQRDRPNRLALGVHGYPFFRDVGYQTGVEHVRSFAMRSVDLNNDGTQYYIATAPDIDAGRVYRVENRRLVDRSAQLGIREQDAIACVPFDYDNDGDLDLLFVHRGFNKQLGAALVDGRISFLTPSRGGRRDFVVAVDDDSPLAFDVFFEGRKRPELLFFGKNRQTIDLDKPVLSSNSAVLAGRPFLQPGEKGAFVWRDSAGRLHFLFLGGRGLEEVFGSIDGSFQPPLVENFPYPQRQLRQNTLYRNDGGHFVDVTAKAGISGNGLGVDAVAADFNNDGFLDVYQVTAGNTFAETNPPNLLFLNNGDGTFSERAADSRAQGPSDGGGNSAIPLDYDRDGDIDLLLLNGFVQGPVQPGPMMLLRNESGNHNASISITLRGRWGNTQAWGANAVVTHGRGRTLLEKNGYTGYLSTSDLPLHVGLPPGTPQAEIEVRWPGGTLSRCVVRAGEDIILLSR